MRALALVSLWLACAAPAHAQIYSWRDANGHLVLSDRPTGPVEHTYPVPNAESVRATRPVGVERGRRYDDLIAEQARLNGVRTDLVRAVVQVESAFNPNAKSPKGAVGLMQLMPSTIQQFGVRNPLNPADNIRAGVAYLRQLLNRYQDEELALAAYNAGPGAVDKHGQSVPPYRETEQYVSRINQMAPRPMHLPGKPLRVPGDVIYKTTEHINGRAVPRYSNHQPASGDYEVVAR